MDFLFFNPDRDFKRWFFTFLILRDLFFKSDSKNNINNFYLRFYWLYRKKINSCGASTLCCFQIQFAIFRLTSRFWMFFFLSSRDFLFNSDSFQNKIKITFGIFFAVSVKIFTSTGPSGAILEKKSTCHFLTKIENYNVVFSLFSETCFQI